jgi:mono/diheme cytochrome c family protein
MKTKSILILGVATLLVGAPVTLAASATANWDEHCASCHGAAGKAETKMGQKLKLKDYSDAKVQAEFTDEALLKATLEGVTVDGKQRMKPYAEKLSAAEAKDLVALIRSFKK